MLPTIAIILLTPASAPPSFRPPTEPGHALAWAPLGHPPPPAPLGRALPPILIRHDRPDSAYVRLGSRYAASMAHVEERAEGTLIAPRWVLTAAHVIEASGPFDAPYVILAGARYRVEKIILHPEWEGDFPDLTRTHDLALLKLDRAVPDVAPTPLYRWDDENGRVATLLGRGKTGTGETGQVGEKGHIVRGATNRVAAATDHVLLFVFDPPGDGDATELEGAAGAGDSGGPALLEHDGEMYLAGVGSFGTAAKGYSAYGALDAYVRVSRFLDWIEGTISADPPPTESWGEPRRSEPWPATPAGRLAGGFFEAYAAGSRDALVTYFRAVGDGDASAARRADMVLDAIREPLGPLVVYGWAAAGDGHIRVLVHSESEDAWRSLGFEAKNDRPPWSAAAADPPRLGHFYMKWESPPKAGVWK